jgi:predicted glycoside hydrolase/deacetylase ChbG (UPF0249 family)
MSLSLIVNADDFGLTSGVNRAVLACHLAGAVTSATLMVNMEGAEEAAAIARAHPSLGIGLHFNLTAGRPLAPAHSVPTLTDHSGRLLTRAQLLRRVFLGTMPSEEIEIELLAQLARLKALGIQPTHIDSHQHVHALPPIFKIVSRLSASAGLPLRVTWRWPGGAVRKSMRRRASEAVLRAMTQRCAALRPANLHCNDGLCSVFDLNAPVSSLTHEAYAHLLDAYGAGVVELMVHPAEVDEELAGKTAITDVSAVENRLLRCAFLAKYVARRNGRMITYRELA